MATRVKFCGATSWDDVALAVEAGADAFGMIFADSPRRIVWDEVSAIALRVPESITPVGVFVNPTHEEIRRVRRFFPNMLVQLSGDEPPAFASSLPIGTIKAIHVAKQTTDQLTKLCNRYRDALVLFDTATARGGGSGETFQWERIAPITRWRPSFVAGGLNPENVGACVSSLRPFGVDVRSGIETDGKKDLAKMRAFIEAVRKSDATA